MIVFRACHEIHISLLRIEIDCFIEFYFELHVFHNYEGYSRNASCALNYISPKFLLHTFVLVYD
jgi:hypothetical protein